MIALAEPVAESPTSAARPGRPRSPRAASSELWILAILFLPLFFVGLGAMGLAPGPEAEAADAGRTIAGGGGLLTPVVGGEERFDRPPLLGWLAAAFVGSSIGHDAAALRLLHALAAFAAVVVVWAFVRRAGRPDAALASAIVLGTSYEIGVAGRTADGFALGFLLSTVAFFALYLALTADDRGRRGWLVAAGLALGLGFLTRGGSALVLPLLGVSAFLFARGRFRSGWRTLLADPVGWLVFAGTALPWFVAMIAAHGTPFLDEFVGERHLLAFERDRPTMPHGGLFHQLPRLALGLFPWSGLAPIALIHMIPARGARREPDGSPAPIERGADLPLFALSGAFVVVVGFSLAWTKQPHAMITGFGPIAIALGIAFADLRRMRPSLGFRTSVALGGVIALAIALWLRLSPLGASWHGWTLSIEARAAARGVGVAALGSQAMMVLTTLLVAAGAALVVLRRLPPRTLFRLLAGLGIVHLVLAAGLGVVIDRAEGVPERLVRREAGHAVLEAPGR